MGHKARRLPGAKPALFIDRDGVIVRDIHLLTRADALQLLPGAAAAIRSAQNAGYAIVVVTNQSVVARGLISEGELEELHAHLDRMLQAQGCAPLDAIRFCPHHPRADEPAYRVVCSCRKPKPGLLQQAAADLGLDEGKSFMIGDRPTDVLAGHRAGCRTILLRSGMHEQALLSDVDPRELVSADLEVDSLDQAIEHILADF